tara:strand:+ start:195 stop:548 length:354 start_codon:yes stop_codon:yes gene_type:complete
MKDPVWKIFSGYLLFILCLVWSSGAFSQIVVTHYNADWNKENNVEWIDSLTDCKIKYIDIGEDSKLQKKHGIVIVPTIIIFNNKKEVKRFQADISFKMVAIRKEVQEEINNLIMNKF